MKSAILLDHWLPLEPDAAGNAELQRDIRAAIRRALGIPPGSAA